MRLIVDNPKIVCSDHNTELLISVLLIIMTRDSWGKHWKISNFVLLNFYVWDCDFSRMFSEFRTQA